MFVLTDDSEILNLAQCLKIVVEGNEIYAYTVVSDSLRQRNLIARFETEVQTGYAYFELFKALKAGKRVWDPYALKPLSALWNKIEKHFSDSNVPNELIGRACITAFSLDTITITYDSQINRLLDKETLAEYQKIVGKKLQELLGDTCIEVKWTLHTGGISR